jgi:hypothetical protein
MPDPAFLRSLLYEWASLLLVLPVLYYLPAGCWSTAANIRPLQAFQSSIIKRMSSS